MVARTKNKATRKYARKRDSGQVVFVGVEVAPETASALHGYCEKNGIKKRFVVEQALCDWLIKRQLLVKNEA